MTRLVYSTGPGGRSTPCDRCGRDPCTCPAANGQPVTRQAVRVRRERAGRKGKTVTVAGPFHLARGELRELLATLKRYCGTGGTLKPVLPGEPHRGINLELQGDHVAQVVSRLADLGHGAKRSSGG